MTPLRLWQKSFRGNLAILVHTFAASRVRIRVLSYSRSRAQQARLVEFPQGYPVAAPGRSQHQYRLAADLSVTPKTALAQVGSTWSSMGGFWGGAADPNHFAFFNPSVWAQLLANCAPKKKAKYINTNQPLPPYQPITIPGLPPPEMPPMPPTLPPGPQFVSSSYGIPSVFNTAATVGPSQPTATTMVGRGVSVIQTSAGPAVGVITPVSSTSVIPVVQLGR